MLWKVEKMQTDNDHNFEFPVIAIKGNIVSFLRTADELTQCSRTGFNTGFYNMLTIINSSGMHIK